MDWQHYVIKYIYIVKKNSMNNVGKKYLK